MRLLRTIRLDPSDTFVFERAADPGEWAVSGAFMFADADPDALAGKSRAAFRGGFVVVASFWWWGLGEVGGGRAGGQGGVGGEAAEAMARCAAGVAAEEEVAFEASLCDHRRDTLIAVRRSFEAGAIREAFRTLHPRGTRKPMRAFSFVEVESEEESSEAMNLLALAREKR